jgi:hypothetical protein
MNNSNSNKLKKPNIISKTKYRKKRKTMKGINHNIGIKSNSNLFSNQVSHDSFVNIDNNDNNDNIDNINNKTNVDYTMLKQFGKEYYYKYYNKNADDTVNKKNNKNRCMCVNYKHIGDLDAIDRCPNNKVVNSDFCELHQDCKSYLRNFLSGYEPEYQPKLWSNPYIEGSHNCYSYFLNRQVKAVKEHCQKTCEKKHKSSCPKKDSDCSDYKPQPGDFINIVENGIDSKKERIYQCPNMQYKILKDNPTIKQVAFNQKCPNRYYKGAMVVDTGNKSEGNTYHFYRQDKNIEFSHKPGISKISDKDASGKKIYIPHFANRDYTEDKDDDDAILYNGFCGYYCIPENSYFHKNLA